jgi:hypothetical protein
VNVSRIEAPGSAPPHVTFEILEDDGTWSVYPSNEEQVQTHQPSPSRTLPDWTIESLSPLVDAMAREFPDAASTDDRPATPMFQQPTGLTSASNIRSPDFSVQALFGSPGQSLDVTDLRHGSDLPLDATDSLTHYGAQEGYQSNVSRMGGSLMDPWWMSSSTPYADILKTLASGQFQLDLTRKGMCLYPLLPLHLHASAPPK